MTLVAGHTWQEWKAAMHKWAHYHGVTIPSDFNPDTAKCGPACHTLIDRIQDHAGIRKDGEGKLGEHTQKLLLPVIPGPTGLERFLRELHWGIDHEPSIGYAMTRPAPLMRWKKHELPLTTDCSASIICASYAAGIVDPSGNHFSGQGNTGSMLNHLHHIPRSEARQGDIAIFGAGDGDHAVAILSLLHGDFHVFSHGFSGGPLDILLSVEARYHVGHPITFLRNSFAEQ